MAFTSLTYFLMLLFTPFYDWVSGIHALFTYSYAGVELQAQTIYVVATAVLLGSYVWWQKYVPAIAAHKPLKFASVYEAFFQAKVGRIYLVATLLIGLLVIWNLHLSGVDISALLDVQKRDLQHIIFSIPFYSNFLENLTNSLITCSVALVAYYHRRWWVWAILLLLWWYFFLAGWRFRIFVSALGVALVYLYMQPAQFYKRLAVVVLALGLMLSFITLNRMAVAKRMFDVVEWNPLRFNIELLCNEMGNSRTFKAMLHYRKTHEVPLDGGMSMIGYIFVKFLPASLYPNGEKPLAPLLKQVKVWIPAGAVDYNPNPAISNVDEVYFSFGLPGCIIFMWLLGFFIAWVEHMRAVQGLKIYLYAVFVGFLYQWITRGYLPQQVQLLFFMLIPWWLEWAYLKYGVGRLGK